jgi:hypothetical protein
MPILEESFQNREKPFTPALSQSDGGRVAESRVGGSLRCNPSIPSVRFHHALMKPNGPSAEFGSQKFEMFGST